MPAFGAGLPSELLLSVAPTSAAAGVALRCGRRAGQAPRSRGFLSVRHPQWPSRLASRPRCAHRSQGLPRAFGAWPRPSTCRSSMARPPRGQPRSDARARFGGVRRRVARRSCSMRLPRSRRRLGRSARTRVAGKTHPAGVLGAVQRSPRRTRKPGSAPGSPRKTEVDRRPSRRSAWRARTLSLVVWERRQAAVRLAAATGGG